MLYTCSEEMVGVVCVFGMEVEVIDALVCVRVENVDSFSGDEVGVRHSLFMCLYSDR